jgi:hypothetical protein
LKMTPWTKKLITSITINTRILVPINRFTFIAFSPFCCFDEILYYAPEIEQNKHRCGDYLKVKAECQDILQARDPQECINGKWFPFLTEKGIPKVPTAFVCKGFT